MDAQVPKLGLVLIISVTTQIGFNWSQFWWKISREIGFTKIYVLVAINMAASEEDQGHL